MVEKTSKLKSDIKDWKQLLNNMSDENILMKIRLSKMLQDNFDMNLLPQVEELYSLLLSEEEFITLLRHNIGELDSLLTANNPKEINSGRFDNLSNMLQSQMTTAKIRITKLKSDINDFLTQEKSMPPLQAE